MTRTFVLKGRLDGETVMDLVQELDDVLETDVQTVIFDFEDVEYISSAGIRAIFTAQREMGKRSGKALVVKPQPAVQKVFDIVKAVDVASVFSSIEELDEYLDDMQRKVAEEGGPY